jgi:hypothetical protein
VTAPPTRIVLVDMPRILRDIIASAIEAQPGMALTALLPEQISQLRQGMETVAADVIVLGNADRGLLDACCALLPERPLTKVLTVSADGLEATLYELRGVVESFGALGPSELASAIGAAFGRGLTWERA